MPDIEDISLNQISDNDYQTYEQIVKKLFDFVIKNKAKPKTRIEKNISSKQKSANPTKRKPLFLF